MLADNACWFAVVPLDAMAALAQRTPGVYVHPKVELVRSCAGGGGLRTSGLMAAGETVLRVPVPRGGHTCLVIRMSGIDIPIRDLRINSRARLVPAAAVIPNPILL